MIYLKTFKLSDVRNKNTNIHPYNIFRGKEPDVFVFENITVLYGNNGAGKSTILNLIAHKLNLKGKERNYSMLLKNPRMIINVLIILLYLYKMYCLRKDM